MKKTSVDPEMALYEQFVVTMTNLLREAVTLVSDGKRNGQDLEQLLKDFVAEPTVIVGELVEQGAAPASTAVVVVPNSLPAPAENPEDNDPTRPHFGDKQVRSPDGLRAGMKLCVRGTKKVILQCYKEEDIHVGDIVDETNNPRGEVTLVSAPFENPSSKRKVLIVSYKDLRFFGSGMRTSRIFLDQLSVVPYQPEKPGERGPWRISAWLEQAE